MAFDVATPQELGDRLTFQRIDLTRPDSDRQLARHLAEHRLDTLFHLAFVNGRVHSGALAHELEIIGTLHVLAAAGGGELPRLVVPSLTALYGPSPDAPAFVREGQALRGAAGSRFLNDKVEVERQVLAFATAHPATRVLVLRFAPALGPVSNNPLTRLLRNRVVPTLLGYDPLWQVLHEQDAAHALHLALRADVEGVFNVVGDGVVPLSRLVRLTGGRALPLPRPLLSATISALEGAGVSAVPHALLDFLRFSWLADGGRATAELGFVPKYSASEACAALRST